MVETGRWFEQAGTLPERSITKLAAGMKGSQILAIAAHVRQLQAQGKEVSNFTIGDFNSSMFAIPDKLKQHITDALDEGQTHYPPAIGVPELREAVRGFYKRELGLDYPEGTVLVGAGARPPIFSAFQTVLEAGDTVLFPVPTWNVGYYAYLNQAKPVSVVTKPENGFMPTVSDLGEHIRTARVLLLNSPLNPAGTVAKEGLLTDLCEAIVAENHRRDAAGERPLILIYDQVYWQLTFGESKHLTPVGLVPEMANYTVMIDAVSKCWAGTGLRVGWSVSPPWLRDRMKPLMGHMGAWAARAEQVATARFLNSDAGAVDGDWMVGMRGRLSDRLVALREGLLALKAEGLPVDALEPQGAIYLTAWFGLHNDQLPTDESVRSYLLEEAGVAVVPFTAFGYPDGTGWVRFSVGSVSMEQVHGAVSRLGDLLRSRKA